MWYNKFYSTWKSRTCRFHLVRQVLLEVEKYNLSSLTNLTSSTQKLFETCGAPRQRVIFVTELVTRKCVEYGCNVCAWILAKVNGTLIDEQLLKISSMFPNFAIVRSCQQAMEVKVLGGWDSHRKISHVGHHGGYDAMLTEHFGMCYSMGYEGIRGRRWWQASWGWYNEYNGKVLGWYCNIALSVGLI